MMISMPQSIIDIIYMLDLPMVFSQSCAFFLVLVQVPNHVDGFPDMGLQPMSFNNLQGRVRLHSGQL